MYQLLTIAIIIAALLLILIVLVQNSKGGGLASNFGVGNRFGGVAEQKSKLESYTWGLVIAIVVMSIISSVVVHRTNTETKESAVKTRLVNQNNVPVLPIEQTPTQQTPAN
ncbi:MAG: preprotein translocase subunit SecG [Bacteroidales bacterium]|nr:preprotein translocase subunit SecG [Bacteroidales bacterium]